MRYKCRDCEIFDFCFKCKNTSDQTHIGHRFKVIECDDDDSSSSESASYQVDSEDADPDSDEAASDSLKDNDSKGEAPQEDEPSSQQLIRRSTV